MKTTYKFILAALAATVTLASCTKDPVPGKSDSDSAVTYRTITVSFDSPTKAKLDGTKPKFQDGDTILLSNIDNFDTCRVTVINDVATIQTKLGKDKPLFAVYPMKAALCTEPNKIFEAGFDIPTKQSGKFSDANICKGQEVDGKLLFTNEYPILRFYVDSTIAVSKIEIKSIDYLAGNEYSITVDAGECGRLDKVTGERVCYVAVREDVNAEELTFISHTKTQDTVERKSPSHIDLQPGVIYNAFIPYSIQVGDQKWGYCNVGAFYPEDEGEYFAWGETVGYLKPVPNWFTADRYKTTDASKLTKDIEAGSTYDAAFVNWGNGWRLPNNNDIENLNKVKLNRIKGDKELLVVNGDLIIPMAERKDGATAGFAICFWSSKFYYDDYSYYIYYKDDKEFVENQSYRYMGMPIRPIYDETISGDDAVGLQISPYTDGQTL